MRSPRQLDLSSHPHLKPSASRTGSPNNRRTTTILRPLQMVEKMRRRSRVRGYERRDAVSPSVDRRKRKAAQQPDHQSCRE